MIKSDHSHMLAVAIGNKANQLLDLKMKLFSNLNKSILNLHIFRKTTLSMYVNVIWGPSFVTDLAKYQNLCKNKLQADICTR